MASVFVDITMSLDGLVTAPDAQLHALELLAQEER
jgi:hypothetical protein